jgi:hypothetical protein
MPLKNRRFNPHCSLYLAGAMCLLLPGCGGSEERERYELSGTVTYQGKPVEMGSLMFEADKSVGDFAPLSTAQIVDGKYRTNPKDSPAAGLYHVRVTGVDMKEAILDPPPGEPAYLPSLFAPCFVDVQVPPPNGVFDIVVPDKTQAKRN